jgi:hypothetical protein
MSAAHDLVIVSVPVPTEMMWPVLRFAVSINMGGKVCAAALEVQLLIDTSVPWMHKFEIDKPRQPR